MLLGDRKPLNVHGVGMRGWSPAKRLWVTWGVNGPELWAWSHALSSKMQRGHPRVWGLLGLHVQVHAHRRAHTHTHVLTHICPCKHVRARMHAPKVSPTEATFLDIKNNSLRKESSEVPNLTLQQT